QLHQGAKMKNWKQHNNTKKVHEKLYAPSDPKDLSSNTYFTLIVKNMFVSKEEHTYENAVWTQTVLEIIFNEEYFSSKIDIEYVDIWTKRIMTNEQNI
ncbi:14815_t:CDS:1, partial [Racocetra persica]